jgi:hypothetical protein
MKKYRIVKTPSDAHYIASGEYVYHYGIEERTYLFFWKPHLHIFPTVEEAEHYVESIRHRVVKEV